MRGTSEIEATPKGLPQRAQRRHRAHRGKNKRLTTEGTKDTQRAQRRHRGHRESAEDTEKAQKTPRRTRGHGTGTEKTEKAQRKLMGREVACAERVCYFRSRTRLALFPVKIVP